VALFGLTAKWLGSRLASVSSRKFRKYFFPLLLARLLSRSSAVSLCAGGTYVRAKPGDFFAPIDRAATPLEHSRSRADGSFGAERSGDLSLASSRGLAADFQPARAGADIQRQAAGEYPFVGKSQPFECAGGHHGFSAAAAAGDSAACLDGG